ncbi:hypothetical protein IX339_000169 [Porphyromonas levii]|uniref:PL29 family lyase N-terminal domain-containing protein n=1 Tax=Porphyromonas levii TaxID=28114 RepID=UPI001B8CE88D|nr:PL29 family lyase N-terminal domain-containing protein [Porphyromonas levii]MBR8730737.1 hypothetical protein [Porphyromonas levii]
MNRRNFALLWSIFLAILVSSCTNLDELYRRLDDYGTRLTRVEEKVLIANGDIKTLQALIKAQEDNITIKSWRPLDDNSGYVLTMSDGSKIVLKNGLNGQSSAVGVKKGEDGILYWTLNGEYMYDHDGNKIQARGEDGKNGVTPQLKVNKDGYWEYSFDGKNWHLILDDNYAPVKATGGGTNDLDITESNGYLVIKFKGQTFVISLKGGEGGNVTPDKKPKPVLTLEITEYALLEGESEQIELGVAPEDTYTLEDVKWTSADTNIATVEKGMITGVAKGETTIKASIDDVSVECKVIVTEKLKINIEVSGVETVFAEIKFTPSDQNRSYKAGVYTKAVWLSNEADKKGAFKGLDLPYWENLSGDSPWWSFMAIDLEYGTNVYQPKELGCPLRPDTEYVVYAYGIDDKGFITGEEYVKEFKTNPRVTFKDFTFTIEGLNVQTTSISATIKPSDPEKTYIATIQSDSFVESRINPDENVDDEAYEKLAYDLIFDNVEQQLRTGNSILERGGRFPGKKYYIIIFGYDLKKGVTTKPVLQAVTTKRPNN